MQSTIIDLPKIADVRGSLSFIESFNHVPFEIKRIYYIYDVPGGESRGAHAHKTLHQLMIAISGSFNVTLSDGSLSKDYFLNKPYQGLYIPPMTWRDLNSFSSGAVCLVLASDVYTEDDYIRNYGDFVACTK